MSAAGKLGLPVHLSLASIVAELDAVFATMAELHADAVVIGLKTAKALGPNVPLSLLGRAAR